MAGAKAQTIRIKPSPPAPSKALLDGFKFRRWDDEEGDVVLKVDETGLLLAILSERAEGIPLYISEINDVRMGKYAKQPKDPKLQEALSASAGVKSFDEIGISIVHGQNMVDVNFINLAATEPGQAPSFVEDFRKLLYNVIGVNVSEEIMLHREYARLCALRNPEKGGIASKHLQSLFDVKNKDEFKSSMSFVGWGVGPKDFIPMEKFTLDTFMKLYENLVPMDYVPDVFVKLRQSKGSKPYATAKEFCSFLNKHHRDPRLNEILFPYLKEDEAKQIIVQMEPNKDYAQKGQLTAHGLRNYLRSKENAIIHLSRFSLHQDMDQPLAHYFINSSHNTYLIGHQLTGKATVEIYRQVLLSGCRCIELDCWDGEDGEPVITHGKTLVNNIPFKDVVEAINESAFKASMFPLILSFENHCRFRQQRRMVVYLRGILGDKLMLETLEDYPLQPGAPLPPPSKLLGKIICKNKLLVPKEGRAREEGSDNSGTLPRNATLDRDAARKASGVPELDEAPASPIKEEPSPASTPETDAKSLASGTTNGSMESPAEGTDNVPADSSVQSDTTPLSLDANAAATSPTSGTRRLSDDSRVSSSSLRDAAAGQSKGLSIDAGDAIASAGDSTAATAGGWSELDMPSLVNYAEPVKFKSFAESEETNKHYQMSSFPETAGVRLVLDFPKDYVRYTKRQNTRIYPKGTRVDSSNYQPQVFWNVGCQMVSLNFQTLDVPMQLNKGKFDYNGMCGFLLKPEVMRNASRDFDPFAESPIDNVVAGRMKVQVLAGHMLSSTKDKVMVEVDMYGIPADTVRRRFKTKSVTNDVTVHFRSQPFEFKKVILCDLAMLRFAVLDSQGSLLGMRVLPLDGLEPGYRYIHLNNENNQSLPFASLFVNIEISEYIPEGMEDICIGLMDPVRYLRERHTEQLGEMMDYDITEGQDADTRRQSDGTPTVLPLPADPVGPLPPKLASLSGAQPSEPDQAYKGRRRHTTALEATMSADVKKLVARTASGEASGVDRDRSKSMYPETNMSNCPKLSLAPSSVSNGRDVLAGKDSVKQLAKVNKEISSIRKKYLKAHATMAKAQASEMKKLNGKGDAMQSLQQSHLQGLIQLTSKSLEDEENALRKHLPTVFAWASKSLASRHAAESKQFDDRYEKQVAKLTEGIQKENAQKSNQYKDDQKRKVQDKDELQRKIREYRFKLVESAVEVRREAERTRNEERTALEKSQEAAVNDLKMLVEIEMEHIKKTYGAYQVRCIDLEGVDKYVSMALDDTPVSLASLAELP